MKKILSNVKRTRYEQTFEILVLLFLFGFMFQSCTSRDDDDLLSNSNAPVTKGKLLSSTLIGSYTPEQACDLMDSYLPGVICATFPPVYGVDVYKIIYETIDIRDEVALVSGALVIPKGVGRLLPIASYQHGTAFSKSGVPSNESVEMLIGLGMAANSGYIVQMPDYLGLGSSLGLHPYHHARTEASCVIDMLRATKSYCAQQDIPLNDQLFLFGYSQGGHSTMAAHKYIETYYSDEFTVTASAPMEGAYDISGAQTDVLLRGEPYPAPYYLPYLLFAYNQVYKMYPTLEEVLKPEYYTSLAPVMADNVTYGDGDIDARMPEVPIEILKPSVVEDFRNNQDHPFRKALRDNDVYKWKPTAPMRMFHCTGDAHVDFNNAQNAYDYFRAQGATNVELAIPLENAGHDVCVLPTLIQGKAWLDTFIEE